RGAKPGDEVRDASRCLREDFYRRTLVMSAPVGRIRVLVGIEVLAGILRDELADKEDRAVRALAGLAINDLGAVGRDQGLALGAHIARHYELDAVTLGRADQRICDAGVAGGRVDDRLLVRERATPLAVLDHRERRAILDRSARVEPLGLGVDLEAWKVLLE